MNSPSATVQKGKKPISPKIPTVSDRVSEVYKAVLFAVADKDHVKKVGSGTKKDYAVEAGKIDLAGDGWTDGKQAGAILVALSHENDQLSGKLIPGCNWFSATTKNGHATVFTIAVVPYFIVENQLRYPSEWQWLLYVVSCTPITGNNSEKFSFDLAGGFIVQSDDQVKGGVRHPIAKAGIIGLLPPDTQLPLDGFGLPMTYSHAGEIVASCLQELGSELSVAANGDAGKQ